MGGPSVRWTGKRYDDASFVSTRSNLSSLSGLVASRTLGPDDDTHDHQVNKVSEICRERPRRQQDHMRQSSHNLETGRASMKGPRMVSFLNSSTSTRLHKCMESFNKISFVFFIAWEFWWRKQDPFFRSITCII